MRSGSRIGEGRPQRHGDTEHSSSQRQDKEDHGDTETQSIAHPNIRTRKNTETTETQSVIRARRKWTLYNYL
jgi:hypothetical protein